MSPLLGIVMKIYYYVSIYNLPAMISFTTYFCMTVLDDQLSFLLPSEALAEILFVPKDLSNF